MKEEKELKKRKAELKNKILTLEWDKKHHQIHSGQNYKLEQYKQELEGINSKLANKENDKKEEKTEVPKKTS